VTPTRAALPEAGGLFKRLGPRAEWEPILRHKLEALGARWPARPIPKADFLAYLTARLPVDGDAREALREVHAADLYLACGCARGDDWALAAFEREHISQVGLFIVRSHPDPAFAEEVKQHLRERLLVAREGSPPRIAGYNGQGPLGGWLRIAAARAALELRRSERAVVDRHQAAAAEALGTTQDPELELIRRRHQAAVEEALKAALAAVPIREANILRLHFFEGVTTPALATLYKVTDRTVRRWIAEARERILAEVRRGLGETLRVPESQLNTLMGLARSRLEVSVGAYLPEGAPDPSPDTARAARILT
jgi:RNA polymerase sigma-70 factor, ECF subfamily